MHNERVHRFEARKEGRFGGKNAFDAASRRLKQDALDDHAVSGMEKGTTLACRRDRASRKRPAKASDASNVGLQEKAGGFD